MLPSFERRQIGLIYYSCLYIHRTEHVSDWSLFFFLFLMNFHSFSVLYKGWKHRVNGCVTSLWPRLSIGRLVGRSVCCNKNRVGKLHFHTPIGALVKLSTTVNTTKRKFRRYLLFFKKLTCIQGYLVAFYQYFDRVGTTLSFRKIDITATNE